MMKKSKKKEPRTFEYRIRYNAGPEQSAWDNYHYYNALNASDALDYHNTAMRNNKIESQTISIEKKNPYSNTWEDESHVINQGT